MGPANEGDLHQPALTKLVRSVPTEPQVQVLTLFDHRREPQLHGAAGRSGLRHDGRMDTRWVELARTLRNLGLWRHLSPEDADVAQRRVVDIEWPLTGFGDEPGEFWFFVDGEDMAEGSVGRELAPLAPRLHEHGVDLVVEEMRHLPVADDGDYVVAINGRRCVVWTAEDWTQRWAWEVATRRPLAVINDLLAEAGATPRLYTLHTGGNEGIAWLLDPRIVDAIVASGLLGDRAPAFATHG
jgi:hypothetical protein